MSEAMLQASMPFGYPSFGHYGNAKSDSSIQVYARTGLSICTIQPLKNREGTCERLLAGEFGVGTPSIGRAISGSDLTLAWAGFRTLLCISRSKDVPVRVGKLLDGHAAVVDQSDGKLPVRICGTMARAVVGKGATIDLHPQAFRPGDTAITSLSHLTIQILQIDDVPTYDIILPRSFFSDFWHWLEESAAEFGLELTQADNG